MNGYFRPMRRKIGVLTLMLACVFTASWVRSRFNHDSITQPIGDAAYNGFSSNERFGLLCYTPQNGADFSLAFSVPQDGVDIDFSIGSERAKITHKLDLLCFHYRHGEGSRLIKYSVWTIRYWAIDLPLIALSAWLLLSTPPQPSEKKGTGPNQ